ncbi:MAG: BrnA antitoxin family protein [Burkholderiales bacterium]|nr:BrnA antitoxin family protein [Burkholderiales bacterium]
MKKSSSSRISKTDWKRVKSMKDHDIKITPEHPELDIKHIARVIVRKGLKPFAAKRSISLRVDAEVLAWFQAQGPGYQTRMNAVLKAFKDASL